MHRFERDKGHVHEHQCAGQCRGHHRRYQRPRRQDRYLETRTPTRTMGRWNSPREGSTGRAAVANLAMATRVEILRCRLDQNKIPRETFHRYITCLRWLRRWMDNSPVMGIVMNGFASGWNGSVSKSGPGQLSFWVISPVEISRRSVGISSYTCPVNSGNLSVYHPIVLWSNSPVWYCHWDGKETGACAEGVGSDGTTASSSIGGALVAVATDAVSVKSLPSSSSIDRWAGWNLDPTQSTCLLESVGPQICECIFWYGWTDAILSPPVFLEASALILSLCPWGPTCRLQD